MIINYINSMIPGKLNQFIYRSMIHYNYFPESKGGAAEPPAGTGLTV